MKHTEHQSSFPYLHPSMWLYLPETSQFLGGAFKGNRERPISQSVSFFFLLLHSQTVGTTTATTERVSIGELSLEVGSLGPCVCVYPFLSAGLGMFSWPLPKMQLPAHKVDSFWRSRPLDVFLTLEMPSSAPDSVTLDTNRRAAALLMANTFSTFILVQSELLNLMEITEKQTLSHTLPTRASSLCDGTKQTVSTSRIVSAQQINYYHS